MVEDPCCLLLTRAADALEVEPACGGLYSTAAHEQGEEHTAAAVSERERESEGGGAVCTHLSGVRPFCSNISRTRSAFSKTPGQRRSTAGSPERERVVRHLQRGVERGSQTVRCGCGLAAAWLRVGCCGLGQSLAVAWLQWLWLWRHLDAVRVERCAELVVGVGAGTAGPAQLAVCLVKVHCLLGVVAAAVKRKGVVSGEW